MKKLTLPLLLLMLSAISHAQFTKGDRYLGGSFQIQMTDFDLNDTDMENFYVYLAPSFTRFKSDRRAAGFKISASYIKSYTTHSGVTTENSRWNFGAGVFWQRYVLLGKGFYLMGEFGADAYTGFGWQGPSPTGSATDINTYGASLHLTPAMGYQLTNRLLVGLQFSNLALVDFSHEKMKYTIAGAPATTKRNSLLFSSSANNTNLGNLGVSFAWKLK